MSEFRGKRIALRQTMNIAANPGAVFPLLCPERERDWIDGWSYEMIYSESGFAELGCVFKTNLPDEGEAYWIMTKHIPPKEAEYIRFIPGLMIINLSFTLREQDNATVIEMAHNSTGLSEQGNEVIAKKKPADYKQRFQYIESALNHFVLTGSLLKIPQ